MGDDLRGHGCLIVEPGFVFGGRCLAGVGGDFAVQTSVVEPVDIGHGGEPDIVETAPGGLSTGRTRFRLS